MELPRKIETGALGETMAAVILQQIGWAPPVKIPQDLGDDLMTFARIKTSEQQAALYTDLSAPVFLQVKGSPTEYCVPPSDSKGESGWWYYESGTDHFDYWIGFGLPYLLLLVDTSAQIAYWASITGDKIVNTNKGRKVFVPFENRMDDTSSERLNQVAVGKRVSSIEGSAWEGAINSLAPCDRLRNALMIPRLIAPHPNRAPKEIGYEQVVAMLMRGRDADLRPYLSSGLCPPLGQWANHGAWGWKFVAALKSAMRDLDPSVLKKLATTAPSQFECDACNIVIASINFISQRAEDDGPSFQEDLDSKPADRGWMLAHQATMHLECGQPHEAAAAARAALFALRSLDGDSTVSVLRGVSVSVLYSVADFGSGELGATITALDNGGSWWRSQEAGWALGEHLSMQMRAWARGASIDLTPNLAIERLEALSWSAAFSCSWASHRRLVLQQVQISVTSSESLSSKAHVLYELVRTGYKAEAEMVARRIWIEGPTSSLKAVVLKLATADGWSQRSEGATMAVLAVGGDLLPSELASRMVERALNLLNDQGAIREFAGGWTDRWSEVDKAVPSLLASAGIASHELCGQFIADNFSNSDTVATSLIRISDDLAYRVLSNEVLAAMHIAAMLRTDRYKFELLQRLAKSYSPSLEMLEKEAMAGSASAARCLLVAGQSEDEHWRKLGAASVETVEKMLSAASGSNGEHSFAVYGTDPLHDLVSSAIRTGDAQLRKAVIGALSAGVLSEEQLCGSVELLAWEFPNLPEGLRRPLVEILPTLTGVHIPLVGEGSLNSARRLLALASGSLDEEAQLDLLTSLRSKDSVALAKALKIWPEKVAVHYLAAMVFDSSAEVRAHSLAGILHCGSRSSELAGFCDRVASTVLRQGRGCRVPLVAAAVLSGSSVAEYGTLLDLLRTHESALVRLAVDGVNYQRS